MTPCKKLGYKEGDKFKLEKSVAMEMMECEDLIITLIIDDGTDCPLFRGFSIFDEDDDGFQYVDLDCVYKIDSDTVETKTPSPQKHIHYDMIVEWAANPSRVVEYHGAETISGDENWHDCPDNQPAWNPETRYRFKPEEPERVFPTTSLTDDELMEVYSEGYSTSVDSYRDIANAAIKRYILDEENK